MYALCRGCGSEIDLNASNCPLCLRPRDRSEMLEDAKKLREAQAAAKRRPWVLLGGTAVLAAGGYAAWMLRGPLRGGIAAVRSATSGLLETVSDPKVYAPGVSMAAPQEPAASPSAAPSKPSAPDGPAQPPAAPAEPAPPAAAEPAPHDWTLPAARTAPSESSILIRGWVYDLTAAKPIPNTPLQFQDRLSGQVYHASADAEGFYELLAPKQNSGLIPLGAAAGYRQEPLEENDPPWHARGPAERRRAAAREPVEMLLTFASRQDEALVNVVLVPLPARRPAMSPSTEKP